ncbi:MAG: cytochrome bc complex cytochrome b subunit [Anaerolineales bacterium]|nr:MAG: cytochrome bc complex cytochrome b subunit [Anaerolineales bacterium]
MLNSLKLQDLRKKLSAAIDQRVRIITAGLGIDELRAVMRGDPPTERPNPRYKVHTTSFLFHIRPRYYERGSTIFAHTFRLGFFTTFAFAVETITGLILMIYYTPSPDEAYSSILNLMSNVPFGSMLRDIHRLGAEAMVIFTTLHMLRTFLTGSYKKDRSFTWLTGVILLGVTLLLSFSGYLLPWDQLAFWAVTIGTSMVEAAPVFGTEANLLLRGAPDIGAGGLLRFYLLHVVLVPLIAILVISIHYYKVAREHGISQPARIEEGKASPEQVKNAKQRVDFIPDLLTHEVFLTALGLFILVAAIAFNFYGGAPLEHIANPQQTPLDTKAPWYFWWLQGMLKLGDKTLMGIILPTIMVAVLVGIPYIDRNPHRSLFKRPWAVGLGLLATLAIVVLSYMGLPEYGIPTPAASRIIQDMAPEEGLGPLREVPFEQLQPGVYEVGQEVPNNLCPDLILGSDQPRGCPELTEVFKDYNDRIIRAATVTNLPKNERLPNVQAVMVIEDWQQDLRKVTMRIGWDDVDSAERKSYERHVYIHRDHGGE